MLILKPNNLFKHVPAISHLGYLHGLAPPPSADHQAAYLDSHTAAFLTQSTPDLQTTLLPFHALTISSGHASNRFVSAKLISCYASVKNLDYSDKVFNSISDKDPFLWSSIIKSHFSNGNHAQAIELFTSMRSCNKLPNQFTVPLVVSACAELLRLDYGRIVHGLVLKIGAFGGEPAVGSSLVYMYGRCGAVKDADQVFDEMNVRDVIAWTAAITGFVQNGESEAGLECFCEMVKVGEDGERPNSRTVGGGIQACAELGDVLAGRCIHGFALKSGTWSSQVVQSSLLCMYFKCGSDEESHLAFTELCEKDLIAWSSIIGVYAKLGDVEKCLSFFSEMQLAGICPDGVVISCLISALGNLLAIPEGRAFHGYVLRRNYDNDQMVKNALLSMYSKFGQLSLSEKLFDKANEDNEEPWNMMVVAYGKFGMALKCIDLFREMQLAGIESDCHSLVSAVVSCSSLRATLMGQSVHSYVIKRSMDDDISVINSLIDMYGNCRNLINASRLFSRTKRNTVTWNTLISSYVHSNQSVEALALFDKMVVEGEKPNSSTMVTVLSACSQLAKLEYGLRIHDYIRSNYIECNTSLSTAMIDMYSKCGKLEISRDIFDSMTERDVITWNVMISSYGLHGDAKSSLDLFQLMENSDATPNHVTFLAILTACSHVGLVNEGKLIFNKMKDYSITPNLKHYACMVDLLGKSGHLSEAEAFVLSMPISPDKGIWGALLSACNIHNEVEMGLRMAKLALESNPGDVRYHIMVSNLNSSAGLWDEAEKSRTLMKELGVEKGVAWSSI